MNLSNKECVPCASSNVSPLGEGEVDTYLNELNGWSAKDSAKKIYKRFKFKNFLRALEFVNKVGDIAEKQKHHPDIIFGWGYCEIFIQTHSIGGLHPNDFILAAKIDSVLTDDI